MAVSTTSNRISYTGNGSTTDFSYPYKFLAEADLVVVKRTIADGTETILALTTDYTVAGEGEDAGGTVTLLVAPSSSYEIIIYGDPELTQLVDLVENDSSPAEVQESALDKLTLIAQRVRNMVERAVRLSDGFAPTFDPTLPGNLDGAANRSPMVNATGDGWADADEWPETADIEQLTQDLEAAEASATASAAAAAASASDASDSADAAAASAAAAAADVAAHEADTTNIHGITDTAQLATLNTAQTFTAEKTFNEAIVLQEESSAPSSPSAGYKKLYAKNNGLLYTKNSAGVEAAVGGGAGGGSPILWEEGGSSPAREIENNMSVHKFIDGLDQELYTEIHVPSSYVAGNPIALILKAYCADNGSNTFLFRSVATLIRRGTDVASSTTNQRTSTNTAVNCSGNANKPVAVILDLTSAAGVINSPAVAAGDTIAVRLYRDTGNDTTAEDVCLLSKQCEVTFA